MASSSQMRRLKKAEQAIPEVPIQICDLSVLTTPELHVLGRYVSNEHSADDTRIVELSIYPKLSAQFNEKDAP